MNIFVTLSRSQGEHVCLQDCRRLMPLSASLRVGFLLMSLLCLSLAAQAQIEIEIEAVGVCEDLDGNVLPAESNMYYVQVDGVSGATQLSVDGATQTWMGTPLSFGPYPHSGSGNSVKKVIATYGTPAVPELYSIDSTEVVETLCGYGNDTSYCAGATGRLVAQARPGSFQAGGESGLRQVYILTEADSNIIITSNGTGLFDGLANGTYCVWAFNYDLAASSIIDDLLQTGRSVSALEDIVMGQGQNGDICAAICDPVCYEVDCVSEPIPTMGEWSLISLFFLLLIFATVAKKETSSDKTVLQ